MTIAATAGGGIRTGGMTAEERKVIFASSLGTVFEWYDFYIYGTLGPFLAKYFFSNVPPNVAFIFTLLAFAAGFAVRPFGALIFGRLGDLVGRKYTFLITMTLMGIGTFFIGLLPGYASWGIAAPVVLIALRLVQGLALGGEYGGAAIYVAEHAPANRRGYFTSWIQTTAMLGLLLSLLVIMFTTIYVNANWPAVTLPGGGTRTAFADWGWRIPFLASFFLLVISLYIRLKMNESPAFLKMKQEGTQSKAPLDEAFGKIPQPLTIALCVLVVAGFVLAYVGFTGMALLCIPAIIILIAANMARFTNGRIAILALLGLVAGQAVVWYTGQFYALFFLQNILRVDLFTANVLIAWSLILGTGGFIVFGTLSDKIGRKPIILAGCLIAAVTYFPVFKLSTATAHPALREAQQTTPVTVIADPDDCSFQFNPTGTSKFTSSCDIAKAFLAR